MYYGIRRAVEGWFLWYLLTHYIYKDGSWVWILNTLLDKG